MVAGAVVVGHLRPRGEGFFSWVPAEEGAISSEGSGWYPAGFPASAPVVCSLDPATGTPPISPWPT